MGEMKMSKKELERVGILERVSKKELSQKEGEMELGLSVRQIRRLIKRIKARDKWNLSWESREGIWAENGCRNDRKSGESVSR